MEDPDPGDVSWLVDRLKSVCDFGGPDFAVYLLSVDDPSELLVGAAGDTRAVRRLLHDISVRKRNKSDAKAAEEAAAAAAAAEAAGPPPGMTLVQRQASADMILAVPKKSSRRNRRKQEATSTTTTTTTTKAAPTPTPTPAPVPTPAPAPASTTPAVPAASSKTPLTSVSTSTASPSSVADAARLCTCQATLHKMLCNCLSCGKIICEMEAGHTCPHCGATLSIATMGKKAVANARKRALKQSKEHVAQFGLPEEYAGDESLMRAIAHKDRLLLFDATAAARSHVYDDQADYYADTSSVWLTDDERAAAAAKDKAKRASKERKRTTRIQFDFTGRLTLVEDEEEPDVEEAKSSGVGSKLGKRIGKTAGDGVMPTPAEAALRNEGNFLGSGAGAGIQQNEYVRIQGMGADGGCAAGSGGLGNQTLGGRASEVYSALVANRGKGQKHGETYAKAVLASKRIQHGLSVGESKTGDDEDGELLGEAESKSGL